MRSWFKRNYLLTVYVIIGFLALCWMQYSLTSGAIKGKEKDFNDKLFAVTLLYATNLRADTAAMESLTDTAAAIRFVQQRMKRDYDSVYRLNGIPLDYELALGITRQTSLAEAIPRPAFDETKDRIIWTSNGQHTEGMKLTRLRITSLGKAANHPFFVKVFFPNKAAFILRSMMPLIALNIIALFGLVACLVLSLKMIRKLSRLARTRNDLINNLAHELKTPLFTISVASKMLIEQPAINNDEKNVSFTKRIQEETARMKGMVEKILHTAMSEANKTATDVQAVNIHDRINTVVERFAEREPGMKNAVHLAMNAQHPVVAGNGADMETLFDNLIDNAYKYRNGSPEIWIDTSNEGKDLLVHVRDNGIGMDAETRRQAFERFFRGHTGDVHSIKGYGIGLSQVRSIVAAHKGSISLKSSPGQGTEFILRLPFSRDENE
jgi:signal transduction histidine kinase